jgi:hypothetical protein
MALFITRIPMSKLLKDHKASNFCNETILMTFVEANEGIKVEFESID